MNTCITTFYRYDMNPDEGRHCLRVEIIIQTGKCAQNQQAAFPRRQENFSSLFLSFPWCHRVFPVVVSLVVPFLSLRLFAAKPFCEMTSTANIRVRVTDGSKAETIGLDRTCCRWQSLEAPFTKFCSWEHGNSIVAINCMTFGQPKVHK